MGKCNHDDIVRLIASRCALDEARRRNYNAQRPVFDIPRNEAECASAEAALGDAQGSYSSVVSGAAAVSPLDVLDVAHEQAVMLDRGRGFVADGLDGYGCDAVWAAAMGIARDLRAEGL